MKPAVTKENHCSYNNVVVVYLHASIHMALGFL